MTIIVVFELKCVLFKKILRMREESNKG